MPSTTTNGTRPSGQPRAGAGLGAVRPKQPTATGAGNDARPGGIGEVLTSALIGGVPALLDEVRTMLAPVAPEYAEYLIEGRADVVVAAEAAMEAFVEHAQRCLSLTQSPREVRTPAGHRAVDVRGSRAQPVVRGLRVTHSAVGLPGGWPSRVAPCCRHVVAQRCGRRGSHRIGRGRLLLRRRALRGVHRWLRRRTDGVGG